MLEANRCQSSIRGMNDYGTAACGAKRPFDVSQVLTAEKSGLFALLFACRLCDGRIHRMAPLSRRLTTRVTSRMAQVNIRSMILKTSVIPICGSPLSSFSTVRTSRWKLTPSPILGEILSLPGRGACEHPTFCQTETRLH